MNKKVSKENFHGRPPHGSVSCFLCCPTLRSTKKGLALVLKRLNYAGSEFFEIVCVTLFEKFHKSFLFPSVACSSYLVTLFSFQGAFPASFETRSKHPISLNACIQSRTISLGPVPDGTRGVPRTSVLAEPNLAAGAIHLPRGCPIPFGAPHLMAIKWGGGPKWTRTTDLTIISRAL